MMLREELRRRLLEERGVYVNEACDKCGQLFASVRFTRKGEEGVWCSAECRGDEARQTIRKGGRPRQHANGAEKQRAYRERVLGVTKPPCSHTETKDLHAQKQAPSYPPSLPDTPALKTKDLPRSYYSRAQGCAS